ncbi:EamA family transporter [Aldersonia sp. NBC_00410]|uniref:EamA family transporter n=1 Tax=Aldersonia sp. NBC_00410 TaxID=2975954 RepID=UPI002259FB09|nr:EamA family transporter [Aldersonia sp. NBC_00410]MCX5043098.1 EamA family transporter [Aldersonia sp. NBC_00410]
MTTRDRNLALLVVLLWGLNFLAIRAGLDQFPPFFFAALRFLVIAIPVVIFVPRPQVPMRWLILYGAGFGVLQFGFLFGAMNAGMPTGLASLVLQSSAPFTVALGALLLGERITPTQLLGLAVAIAGMALIGWDRAEHATLLPVALTLLGGLGWAFGNIGSRLAAAPNPLHLTLWMTVVAPLPMLALSASTEGPTTGWRALADAFGPHGWPALVGLAYIVVFGTIAGSGIWCALLSRYPTGRVAPYSLLVPVVGITVSWLVLHEKPSVTTILGGLVVIVGAAAATGVRLIPAHQQLEPVDADLREIEFLAREHAVQTNERHRQ